MNWMLCLAFIMGMSLASCGDDEEGNMDNPQPGTEGLDEKSQEIIQKYADIRLWIGQWRRMGDANHQSWVFESDGTALLVHSSYTSESCDWRYLPDSNTLGTTYSTWTWTIGYQENEEWGGTSPGGHFYSYERDWWSDPNDELLIGTWVCEEKGSTVTFTAGGEIIMENGGESVRTNYRISQDLPRSWEEDYRSSARARNIDAGGQGFSVDLFINELDGYKMTIDNCSFQIKADNDWENLDFEGTYIFSAYVD